MSFSSKNVALFALLLLLFFLSLSQKEREKIKTSDLFLKPAESIEAQVVFFT